jgi:hypothetical protein
MIHISTKSSAVTLINVFTVDPTHQQRLVELLTRAAEGSVRRAPGSVSASLPSTTAALAKSCMYLLASQEPIFVSSGMAF